MRGLDRKHNWGVILGGGDGMRLRPLTRLLTGDDRPKQFCRLGGEETLLALTRRRVARALALDRTLLVMTKAHAPYYAAELAAVPPRLMVVQPDNRGTLPAILWSLLSLARLDEQAIAGFFPSDHYVADEETFTEKVTAAFAAAEDASGVILLGAADGPGDGIWLDRSGANGDGQPVAESEALLGEAIPRSRANAAGPGMSLEHLCHDRAG